MAIIKKKQLKTLSKTELTAKLNEVETELKRAGATKDKNTSKKKELKKLRSRILNYLATKTEKK